MRTQSNKTAGRSAKAPRQTLKKSAKTLAKNGRAADKKAAKSARSPVGKSIHAGPGSAKLVSKSKSAAKVALKTASKLAAKPAPKTAAKVAAILSPSAVPSSTPKMIRTASPPVQPVFDTPLKRHRYHVGDIVYYTSPTFGRAAANGSYTVVKLLPSEGDDHQYRIKSTVEAFERVAKESQLDPE